MVDDDNKMFPLLLSYGDQTKWLIANGCPRRVPWAFIEPHAKQAWATHGQTLERLAERGGLCVAEMVCVLDGLRWGRREFRTSEDALPRLLERLAEWQQEPDQSGEGVS